MSSGAAQNERPASAPGEDAPLADSADRNEVNASLLLLFTSLYQRQCSWSPLFSSLHWASLNRGAFLRV